MTLQLYCSITGASLERGIETDKGEKGYRYQHYCRCHDALCKVRCVQCGLASYSNASKHSKQHGHCFVQENSENSIRKPTRLRREASQLHNYINNLDNKYNAFINDVSEDKDPFQFNSDDNIFEFILFDKYFVSTLDNSKPDYPIPSDVPTFSDGTDNTSTSSSPEPEQDFENCLVVDWGAELNFQ